MSDAEFDTFLQKQESLAEEAAHVHGCTKTRWHSLNFQDMATRVRDNIPAFFSAQDRGAAGLMFASFDSTNSAIHGDALFLRTQYNARKNAPLELVYDQERAYLSPYPSTTAMQALWGWKCIGMYYNQLDYVDKCINDNFLEIVKKHTR